MATNPTLGDFYDANNGNIWLQPDDLNSTMQRLACHDIGDIDEPFGDITQRYCADPTQPGQWRVVHVSQGPPERVTTDITVPLGKTSDYLEQVSCAFPAYVVMSKSPDRRNFLAYDRVFRLLGNRFSNKGKSNLAMREGNDLSEMTFGLSADSPLGVVFPLVSSRQVTTEAQNLLCMALHNDPLCNGPYGAAKKSCNDLFAGAKSATAPTSANVIFTNDRGNNWAATTIDPFSSPGGENVSCMVSFSISRTGRRVIAGRGTADASNPAEVAYSDDGGATWTNVNVGASNSSFFPWSGSLFALDKYHIWGVLSNGDIFFSGDGGASWTEQVTPNTNALHSIHFVNENFGVTAGASNTIYKTEDGGAHWTALVGPTAKAGVIIRSAHILDAYNIWLAYTDGDLYYTRTGGAAASAWSRRTLPGTVTGIGKLVFLPNRADVAFCGYRTVSATNYPLIGRSWNGGMDWELYVDTANPFATDPTTVTEGLNDLIFCDTNMIQAVGDVISGTASIYTLTNA